MRSLGAILICSSVACSAVSSLDQPPSELTDGELQVMRGFFDDTYVLASEKGLYVHLDEQTVVPENLTSETMTIASESTRSNFFWINRQQTTIPGDAFPTEPVRVDSLHGDSATWEGWEAYYKTYPKSVGRGIISRVGFNDERTEALLYFGIQSQGLAGSGHLILLRLQGDQWVMTAKHMIWIS